MSAYNIKWTTLGYVHVQESSNNLYCLIWQTCLCFYFARSVKKNRPKSYETLWCLERVMSNNSLPTEVTYCMCYIHKYFNTMGKQTMRVILTLTALNKYNKYNLNFHQLEFVSRCRDPQLQVGENYWYLFNLRPNICKKKFISNIGYFID